MVGALEARPHVGYFYSGKARETLVAEYLQQFRVKDLKSVPTVVEEKTSVYDATVMMFLEDVGTLFVVSSGGVLEGVISRKDLLRFTLGQGNICQTPVSVIMTRMPNVVTTFPEETVLEAARKIVAHEVDALPVVRPLLDEEQGEKLEVVGRITKTTLARLFVEVGTGK